MHFYDEFQQWKLQKQEQVAKIPDEILALAKSLDSRFRPFVNHVVKEKQIVSFDARKQFEARARQTVEVGLNSFYFPANMLEVDFLSDSGTSAMTTL